MNNTDMYMNSLLNILNGESTKENPLFYFTKKYDSFDIEKICCVNNNSYLISEQCIDVDTDNNIYLFNIFNNNIYLLKYCNIKKETIVLKEINSYSSNCKVNIYCLKIIENKLWYTTIEKKEKKQYLRLNCMNLTNENVISIEIGELDKNVKIKIYYNTKSIYYLYLKNGNSLYRLKQSTKEFVIGTLENIVINEVTNDFEFEVIDFNTFLILDNDILTKYYKNKKSKEIPIVCDKCKRMEIEKNHTYISGVICNNTLKIIKINNENLKKTWELNIDNCFKDFKAHNSEIYIFDNYINKVDYKGNIISKKKFNYLIKGFVLGKDLNLYVVSENNLYIVKQYYKN